MKIEAIALSKLENSPDNVRRTVNKTGFSDLKASILAHGLMQNLVVVAKGDKYQVVAGSRRLAALQELEKEGKFGKGNPINCCIVESKNSDELSLAENIMREAMHPADEYEAFAALINEGKNKPSDVALRFGCSIKHVEQRMQLGKVHPDIMKAFRAGKIDLKALMAFTICEDQKKQINVFKSLKEYERGAHSIREKLTSKMFASNSAYAKFVGRETYEKAGGQIYSDLFSDLVFFEDGALLTKLASEKAGAKIEKLKSEGWGFIEFGHDNSGWEFCQKFDRLHKAPKKADLPKCGVYLYIDREGKLAMTMLSKGKDSDKALAKKKSTGISQALRDDLQAYRMEAFQVAIAHDTIAASNLICYSAALTLLDGVYYGDHFSMLNFAQALSSKGVINEKTIAKSALKNIKAELDFSWNKGTNEQKFSAFILMPEYKKAKFLSYAFARTLRGRLSDKLDVYTLAGALPNTDISKYWKPTYENYFKRVDQATIDKIGKQLFLSAWKSSKNKRKDATFIAEAITRPEKAAGSDKQLLKRLQTYLPSGMSFSLSGDLPNEKSKPVARSAGGKFTKKAS